MPVTSETCGGRMEEIVRDDRISTLPEDLLVTILMSLPIKDAVTTMILSKRWRFIWTMLPVLKYKEGNDDFDYGDFVKDDEDDEEDDEEDEEDDEEDEEDEVDDEDDVDEDDDGDGDDVDDDDDNDNDVVDDDDDDDNDNDVVDVDDDDKSKKSVWWFLDKSLSLHKAPVLHRLCMELGPRCPTDVDVGKWVAKAVDRGVELLQFKLRWSADPTSLPKTLYSCLSLKTLALSHKILVDVPSSACLPSLKVLNLNRVVYKDEDSLVRLLSSCPILELLFVKRKRDDNVKKFTVKTPSLLQLTYTNYSSWTYVKDTARCLVIDTPALTKFDITDYSGDSCSIENTPCLEKASVQVDQSFPNIVKFLTYFSAVSSFLALGLSDEMTRYWSNIRFSRLTKCMISPRNTHWMYSLVPFLQNTPKLKFLIIDYRSTRKSLSAFSTWSTGGSYPECLYSSLDKFEVIGYGGRKEEQELVEYILTFSRCLKTARISFRFTLTLDDRHIMREKLKAIPRVSKISQILFKS